MRKKELAQIAVEALEKLYPDAICSLDYKDAFQLLISTRLSAQCTDARVNLVTPQLFERFPDAKSMGEADVSEVEQLIKSCGLYKTKAKDLVGIGKMLTEQYGGVVPDTIEELTKLPGVGRKTANLVCGDIYKKSAVVADTHFIRLCNRLGFVNTTDPFKVEMEMRKILPPEKSNDFCHRAVLFGRDICTARKAFCERCPINDKCPKKIKKK
ncbi:MAG: endonuclease III [Clostridia bacterium]|nr:endonuclease III [Clostridia bacterium]MBQ2237397.1 endonuclease III [Clostridia bacterium]MEE1185711.1 endonuclease III [Acutalibacteraceae bacterium]